MTACDVSVRECVIHSVRIVEKEFEVGKNWSRKKLGWSTYLFRVVILDPIAAS
jgi:hypothetical protein